MEVFSPVQVSVCKRFHEMIALEIYGMSWEVALMWDCKFFKQGRQGIEVVSARKKKVFVEPI